MEVNNENSQVRHSFFQIPEDEFEKEYKDIEDRKAIIKFFNANMKMKARRPCQPYASGDTCSYPTHCHLSETISTSYVLEFSENSAGLLNPNVF